MPSIPAHLSIGYDAAVAPHAGAWIEIVSSPWWQSQPIVAPHAGAWIEITMKPCASILILSPPTRGRGLKFCFAVSELPRLDSRPPRGGVD